MNLCGHLVNGNFRKSSAGLERACSLFHRRWAVGTRGCQETLFLRLPTKKARSANVSAETPRKSMSPEFTNAPGLEGMSTPVLRPFTALAFALRSMDPCGCLPHRAQSVKHCRLVGEAVPIEDYHLVDTNRRRQGEMHVTREMMASVMARL